MTECHPIPCQGRRAPHLPQRVPVRQRRPLQATIALPSPLTCSAQPQSPPCPLTPTNATAPITTPPTPRPCVGWPPVHHPTPTQPRVATGSPPPILAPSDVPALATTPLTARPSTGRPPAYRTPPTQARVTSGVPHPPRGPSDAHTPTTTTTTASPHMGWPLVHRTPPAHAPVASRVPPPTSTINQASTSTCQQRTHAPRVGTTLLCPVPGCTTPSSSTSKRLQHIRRLHPDCSLTGSQLRDIGAVYCPTCSNLRSVTGRGHRCPPTAPQIPQPPDPGPRQEFQTPEPGLIPSPNTSPPASRQLHPAPAPLDGPATPISQTVPYAAHEAWGRATATHIRAITSAVRREEPNAVREATDRLLALPRRVLDARGRGAARRTVACLNRVHRGEPLDDEQMQGEHPDERPGEGFRNGPLHHQQRRRIHRQLRLGNISRAARVLQESPLATVTDEVLEVLTALHPHEDTPQPPAADKCPVQITPGISAKVLDKVPRG
jgi:hypothetical protein